jgi:phosphomannomutase/phosphoglucomutase
MNPHIFREYDIRGIVDKDLTDDTVNLIGLGFSSYLSKNGGKRISIGGDVRNSSARFMKILSQAAVNSGLEVINIGHVPTPVSYYSLHHLDVDGGIMVTGSHNPAEFNGFKLAVGKTTIYGSEIQNVKEVILKEEFVKGSGKSEDYDIITPYCDELKKHFSFKKKLKIVIDAGNGTAGIFVPRLFRAMGVEVVELFCEVDGNFPNHHPDPTVEKNLTDLIKKVGEVKADAGVAYDGDSDRIGVVDDKGRVIWGDYLLLLYALEILKKQKDQSVIFEVKCSKALEEEISKAGGTPIMWKTGHSLLKAKMKETGAVVAGEMSGHMFFADRYYGYDDAIYASCRLFEILDRYPERLSDMRDRLPNYVSTPEIRLECRDDEEKFRITEEVKSYFKSKYKTIDIDGVRVLFEKGWGLVRSSNTQPILVVRFEADTQDDLDKIKSLVLDKIKEFGDFTL